MNVDQLKRRVERSEQLMEGRVEQASFHRAQLGKRWRETWTPGRIVIAGLVGGFLVARVRPLRGVGSVPVSRWLQLATSLSGLFASLKASSAAESAETAANEAATEAGDAADATEAAIEDAADRQTPSSESTTAVAKAAATRATVSDGRRRAEPRWEQPPPPAEAATEISER